MVCQREGGLPRSNCTPKRTPSVATPPHRDRLGHLRAEGGK